MTHEKLRALFTELADDVSQVPQREYTGPAWTRARQLKRRYVALGTAAAVVLIAVPVALFFPRGEAPVQPGNPVYSQAPLRARAAHSATLLPDGRVLVIGGCATDGCSTAEGAPSTEFYVPGQGFTAGPELTEPRQGHSATLLRDGRVLIAGGWPREGAETLSSAEVYDPSTRRFESVGSMNKVRGGHLATPLPDGRVLFVGGEDGNSPTKTAEIFDPSRNAFTPAASLPEGSRIGGTIALADGRVLVVGGQDDAGNAVAGAIYDPQSGAWQRTSALGTARSKFALAPLPDGKVMVLGGTSDDRILLRTTEIYDPATGEFTPGPTMGAERYKFIDAIAVDSSGRFVVGGGTQVEVYSAGQFHPISGTTGPVRWVPTVTRLTNGDVLLIGGYDGRIDLHSDALLITAGQIAGAAG
jgi:hypothetical protein